MQKAATKFISFLYCIHLILVQNSHLTIFNPSISRDLKIENLLIDASGERLKLCDFGSATTTTYAPDQSWNMSQRTRMEEEIAKATTPMYRAPEMVDEWSNFPVRHYVDYVVLF